MKGNQDFFGMKTHIWVDDASGLVHHVECTATAANAADITQAHKLLHGKEDTVCGDSGYTRLDKREEMKRKLRYLIAEKPSKLKQIKSKRALKSAKRWEHTKASLRAKVEHPFRVIKRQFGYVKVCYRSLAENTVFIFRLRCSELPQASASCPVSTYQNHAANQ